LSIQNIFISFLNLNLIMFMYRVQHDLSDEY